MSKTVNPRVDAFRDAILNTLVRMAKSVAEMLGMSPDLITRSSCMESSAFRRFALVALNTKLFAEPIEPAMENARLRLYFEIKTLEV